MTKYLDENGLLYLWGKLKATFLHNATEGRFTGVSTNTNTGLRSFNVPTIAEHIYYDSNKNSTLKDKIDTIVSQGGEPNTIETVKVNGTALVPDANKAVNVDLSGYLPLTGGTLTGSLTVNGSVTLPTGSVHVQYGDLHVDKIVHNIDPNDCSATKFWATNGTILDLSTSLSGYLPLTGGTMATTGAIYFDTGGFIQYDSTTQGMKIISTDAITMTAGGTNTISVSDDTDEILLSASFITAYGEFQVRDGGVLAYDQVDRSNTKVWNTNGGITNLATYAPLASPALTGTPTAPTAAAGTNTTQIATTSFVNTAITNALGNFTGVSYEVVQTLPASGAAGTIYLISNSGTNPNIYDEYIYVNNGFEKIGTTDVDLTGYWSKTELVVIPNTTIDYIVTNHTLPS